MNNMESIIAALKAKIDAPGQSLEELIARPEFEHTTLTINARDYLTCVHTIHAHIMNNHKTLVDGINARVPETVRLQPAMRLVLMSLDFSAYDAVVEVNRELLGFLNANITQTVSENNSRIKRINEVMADASRAMLKALPYGWEKFKLAELRELAAERGLHLTGTRADLIARIREFSETA